MIDKDYDAKIFQWAESVFREAPPMLKGDTKCIIALPSTMQRAIGRHSGSMLKADSDLLLLTELWAHPVVIGYEMAFVLYHPEGAINPAYGVYRVAMTKAILDK